MYKNLSQEAQNLIKKTTEGIPFVVDSHMHVLGIQEEKTGCFVHPSILTSWNPFIFIKTKVLLSACGITDKKQADKQMVEKMDETMQNFTEITGKPYFGLTFAFTAAHDRETGEIDRDKTGMHIPNSHVIKEARPNWIPVGSVHPYDKDIEDKFRYLVEKEVQVLKLLPNSMAFLPSDEKCERYFELANEHRMTIITHVGDEHSVSAGGIDNSLGNPYHFRPWLIKYPELKIVFAHVGSEGRSEYECEVIDNFDLVINLLKEFPEQSFADISAFTSSPYRTKYLKGLLEEKEIHKQLLFGSDYPLPAIRATSIAAIWNLYFYGLVDFKTRGLLLEIHKANSLLYNFVAMRVISSGNSLPKEIFYENVQKILNKNPF